MMEQCSPDAQLLSNPPTASRPTAPAFPSTLSPDSSPKAISILCPPAHLTHAQRLLSVRVKPHEPRHQGLGRPECGTGKLVRYR